VKNVLQPMIVGALLLSLAAGCRGEVSTEPPIVPIRNMYNQPRYDAQERSAYFQDQRNMRPQVEGTVSREMEVDYSTETGRLDDESGWVMEVPRDVMQDFGSRQALVERGQERYNITCAPCHGISGHGDGLVAMRAVSVGAAALNPPTFHGDRVRQMPDGQLYATITHGIRSMPSYRHNVQMNDRWAIVSYVRALQLSQQGVEPLGEEN